MGARFTPDRDRSEDQARYDPRALNEVEPIAFEEQVKVRHSVLLPHWQDKGEGSGPFGLRSKLSARLAKIWASRFLPGRPRAHTRGTSGRMR